MASLINASNGNFQDKREKAEVFQRAGVHIEPSLKIRKLAADRSACRKVSLKSRLVTERTRSIFGSYLAVRVELATIKEQIRAQSETIKDHTKRIERLEGEYFRAD